MGKYEFIQHYEGWEEFQSLDVSEKIDSFLRDGKIYDVLMSQQFDRQFLEELYVLINTIRAIAKTKDGIEWLHGLHYHLRAMLYFVQPSTRTFLSFQNACHILGMHTSEIRDPHTSSEIKGESPEDSIRTFSSYVDMIVMRHPIEGFAEKTAWLLNNTDRPVPLINAGSGRDQHPTQALLDMYTLMRSFEEIGGVDGKVIAMVGDLKRGRTVRSLSYLMKNFEDTEIIYASPEGFRMEEDIKDFLRRYDISFREVDDLESILPEVDAIYMTRIQDEHDQSGKSQSHYEEFSLKSHHLEMIKPHTIIMHPLPRRGEIEVSVDQDPRAMYWRQERNGMWTRAALMSKIFGSDGEILERGE